MTKPAPPTEAAEAAEAARQLRQLADQLAQLNPGHGVTLNVSLTCRVYSPDDAVPGDRGGTLLTDIAAAARLNCTTAYLRGLVRCGALPGYVTGRSVRVDARDVDHFASASRVPGVPIPDPLYTVTEAAQYLGVDRAALYKLRKNGTVPEAPGPGRRPFVRLSDLRRHLHRNAVRAGARI